MSTKGTDGTAECDKVPVLITCESYSSDDISIVSVASEDEIGEVYYPPRITKKSTRRRKRLFR